MTAPLLPSEPLRALWLARHTRMQVVAYHALLNAGITTIGDLTACNAGDLLSLPKFGTGSLAETERALSARGLSLRPGGRCDVYRIHGNGQCQNVAGVPFRAVCGCGHDMQGNACESCRNAMVPGCLTCWQEKHHRCGVRFEEPVLEAVAS